MERKKFETKGCLFIRTIPSNLKDHFKSWCSKRGMTMTEAIVKYMRECVNSNKVEEDSK